CRSWKEGRPRYQRTRGKKGGVKKLRHWIPKGDNKLLYEFLPNETSRQTHALDEAVRVLDGRVDLDGRGIVVLDLGCGDGHSFEMFSARNKNLRWAGLDVLDSQEVISRPLRRLPFCSYDGINLPIADGAVDVVYSRQVFEHVRHPERLMGEV